MARYALVAAVFLALGVAAAVGVPALLNSRTPAPTQAEPADAPDAPDAADETAVGEPILNEAIAAPAGPAETPEAAVAQFLAAEQREDYAASFALLAASTREAVGTSTQWTAAHADIPAVTAWRFEDMQAEGDTSRVFGTVGFAPQLDEVAGLVPGSASATWQVVRDDGTWFVDFDESQLLPRYPDDTTADDAVRAWVTAQQQCESGPQYDGGLLGRKGLAGSLCDAPGEPEVAEARELETLELDVLLPAFGAEAEIWGRAVDVAGPVPLRALVAPLGDDWIVVGVMDPA